MSSLSARVPSFAARSLMIVFCAAACFAQDPPHFTTKAFSGSNVSYYDLVRDVFPQLRISETDPEEAFAHNSIPLRHLFREDKVKILEASLTSSITINIAQRLETTDKGGKVLWLMLNAVEPDKEACAGCYRVVWAETVLAAYRPVGQWNFELVDAAMIKTGDITAFDEEHPKLSLGSHGQAVVVANVSQLSAGAQDTFSIVDVGNDGFRVLLREFAVKRDFRCAEWYSEAAQIRLLTNAVKGYKGIRIRVISEGGTGDLDYPNLSHRRRFTYIFAWQPREQKYRAVVDPDGLRRRFLKRLEPCKEYQ